VLAAALYAPGEGLKQQQHSNSMSNAEPAGLACAAGHWLLLVMPLQVEQILSLRSDLMEATEKLRRAESDKQQAEADIASLKQQVRGNRQRQQPQCCHVDVALPCARGTARQEKHSRRCKLQAAAGLLQCSRTAISAWHATGWLLHLYCSAKEPLSMAML
jgi:hypothetical protein